MTSETAEGRRGLRELASTPVTDRIHGVDLARAVAIVGMVMVHIGPIYLNGHGLTGELYRLPHGRASILFVVVAGIGVSLLAADRSPACLRATSLRLLWAAVALLPLGVALQALDTRVAVIIQYYAVYFLIALVAIRLRSQVLLLLAAASALVGPAVVIGVRQLQPQWFDASIPIWSDLDRLARDLVVSGYYPALVWATPLLIGMWLGRRDLRSAKTAAWLVLAGGLVAAGGILAGNALDGAIGDVARGSWLQLLTQEPHQEMALWVVASTGVAVALVGVSLLVARLARRASWPLVALGQLALTVYVVHLIVLATLPEWLIRADFAGAWASVGRFALVAIAAALLWRLMATRGPVEALLHLPWWTRRKRAPQVTKIGPQPAPAGDVVG